MIRNKIPKTIYSKFLGFLTKKGKKVAAKRLLDNTFLILSKQRNFSPEFLILNIFLKLNSFVEIKKVRIKRSTHMVPFSTTFKRRSYLAIKWLMEAVQEDKRLVSTQEKILHEINCLLDNSQSKSLKKKTFNISQSLLNRSNIHYRW